MDLSPNQPRLHAAFIVLISVVITIFLGTLIGSADYQPILIGAVVIAAVIFWIFSGRYFWVFAIASSFLAGTFPILRGQFTTFHVLMVMGIAKFLLEDVILRRVRLKMPGRFDLLMIAGFMSVILAHGIQDRFGMRFLGSDVWGGRYYVNVFIGLLAFFVIQRPVKSNWSAFPYVVLAFAGFDLVIALITTVVPGSIYFIYPFYSAVAISTFQEAIGASSDVTGRIGAFGTFGLILMTLVLATVSLRTLLHPSNFFKILGMGVGGFGVLISGYRSAILNAFLLIVSAGIRDLKKGALLLIPAIAAACFFLSVVNSEFVRLPKQVQRGLAFLPGNWDFEMARDAAASNDFRLSIWSLWWREYFPHQALLGRGFGFEAEWTKKSIYYGDAADFRQMVETGNIHNGFIAAVDTFGIVGTIFFVIWNASLLVRALRVPFDRRAGEYRTLRFLALYLAVSTVSYFIGSQSVGSFLPQQFALAGLFIRLRADLKPEQTRAHRPQHLHSSEYAAIERNSMPRPIKQRREALAFRRNTPRSS